MKGMIVALCLFAMAGCGLISPPSEEQTPSDLSTLEEQLSQGTLLLGEATQGSFFPMAELNSESAISLVLAELNSLYFGYHEAFYLELLDSNEEIASTRNKVLIQKQAFALVAELWAEYPNEETYTLAQDTLEQLYQHLQCQVLWAKEEGDDFLVGVAVTPFLAYPSPEKMRETFLQFVGEIPVSSLSMEEYAQFDNDYIQFLLEQIRPEEVTVGNPVEYVLRLVKEETGYRLSSSDLATLEEGILTDRSN